MRSTSSLRKALVLLAFLAAPAAAGSPALEPYKDELFRYPAAIESRAGGDFVTVPFDYRRDVIERDEKPDERTRPDYVSLESIGEPSDLVLRRAGLTVRYVGVGNVAGGARVVVIFLHGLGATRHDGMNDWRSGGNLNRIKNLMVRNGGAYLSADYSRNRSRAGREIGALVEAQREASPDATIVLACASIAARICWDIVSDPASPRIEGMIMIAGVGRSELAAGLAALPPQDRVPIYIAHGNKDRSVSPRQQLQLFDEIKTRAPDYPIRFVLFDGGVHRTPLRMIDWRLAINWIDGLRAP